MIGAYKELFTLKWGGIMAIYKWAVKLNSPRLACHDAAVKVYIAECVSPTINTQPSGLKKKIY